MAKLTHLPPAHVRTALRGKIQYTVDRGIGVAKKWPRKRPGPKTPAQQEQIRQFTQWVADLKQIEPSEIAAAHVLAENSGYTWRDVISRASVGRIAILEPMEPDAMPDFNVQGLLNQLGTDAGMIIVNTIAGWVAVPPGDPGQVLAIDVATGLPFWIDPTDTGISQLTGDITAGPGSGSQAATLSTTGVTPGTYTRATVTVDAKGRITSAADGATDAGITQLTGDVTAGPGNGSQAATLTATGVTAGPYTSPDVTIDAKGRITAAANGNPAAAIAYMHPGYVSNRWYTLHSYSNFTTAFATGGLVFATPIVIASSHTFTGMAIFPNGNLAGATCRIGLYDNAGAQPGTKLYDSGQFSTATSGFKSFTGLTLALTAGVYWMVGICSAGQGFQSIVASGAMAGWQIGVPNGGTFNQTPSGLTGGAQTTATALPTPFVASANMFSNIPLMWLLA